MAIYLVTAVGPLPVPTAVLSGRDFEVGKPEELKSHRLETFFNNHIVGKEGATVSTLTSFKNGWCNKDVPVLKLVDGVRWSFHRKNLEKPDAEESPPHKKKKMDPPSVISVEEEKGIRKIIDEAGDDLLTKKEIRQKLEDLMGMKRGELIHKIPEMSTLIDEVLNPPPQEPSTAKSAAQLEQVAAKARQTLAELVAASEHADKQVKDADEEVANAVEEATITRDAKRTKEAAEAKAGEEDQEAKARAVTAIKALDEAIAAVSEAEAAAYKARTEADIAAEAKNAAGTEAVAAREKALEADQKAEDSLAAA